MKYESKAVPEATTIMRPGKLLKVLTTEERLCIMHGLDIKYKNSLAKALAALRTGRPHPKDESYIQIHSQRWRIWFGKTPDDVAVTKYVQKEIFKPLNSWKEGEIDRGFKLSDQERIAVRSMKAMQMTQEQYLIATTDPDAKASDKMAKNIRNRLSKKSVNELIEMPSDRFNEVAINTRAILVASPVLVAWITYLDTNGSTNEPRLLGKEVKGLVRDKGKDAAVKYLVKTHAALASWLAGGEFVSQRYYRIDSGRLQEQSSGLQGETSLATAIALNGHWDYDIEACGPAIAMHIAIEHSLPCANIACYVTNKEKIRKDIAKQLKLPVDIVKQAFTAMVYGGKAEPHKAIYQILGSKAHRKFMELPKVGKLYDELQGVFNKIVACAERTPDGKEYINRQGGTKSVSRADKEGQLVALYIQGDESEATDAALMEHTSSVLAKFDGWVCSKKESTKAAEQAILDATGMSLKVAEKRLRIDGLPINFEPMIGDDWDYWLSQTGAI